MFPSELSSAVRAHSYPLLFATVSGAHLYGFPSADSDWDLRGVHILPAQEVMGLFPSRDTIEVSEKGAVELDLVTHDIRKFFSLMLRPNGYVLEQLFSPLVVHAMPEHEELKRIGSSCITKFHVHHYLGFAGNQWRLFQKDETKRIKPLLYVFRVLLTGIYLMQTGRIEANLTTLNEQFKLPFIPELVARKKSGSEHEALGADAVTFYGTQYTELERRLLEAGEKTGLPSEPTARPALNDLLIRMRLSKV